MLDCKYCDYGQAIHIIESENVLKAKPTASDYRKYKRHAICHVKRVQYSGDINVVIYESK